MPVVLLTPEELFHKPAKCVDMLREANFEIEYPTEPTLARGLCSEQETIEQLSVCDAVIAGGEWFTKDILAALPRLRVIVRMGVGYDRVDVVAASERGIPVTITPNSNFDAVAEHTFALIFSVAKSVVNFDRSMRAGQWQRELTSPLRKHTLGIFGLGRIGRAVAVRASAMGMKVIATEKYPDDTFVQRHAIQLVDLDVLLAESDYLSVHCPLNEETEGMFNKDLFAKMKPRSVFINTARGKIHVEADLIKALSNGHLRAAGLDVFEEEPPVANNPLFEMDNVVVTPHIGGEDTLSVERMGIEAAECIIKLHNGEWPAGAALNDELRDGWKWRR